MLRKIKIIGIGLIAIMLLAALPVISPCAPKTVKVELWTGKLGAGTVYLTNFAIAQTINKNHPWLRVDCMASLGGFDNLFSTEVFPAERKKTLLFSLPGEGFHAAIYGEKPWVEKTYDIRSVTGVARGTLGIFTIDPNIKTAEDLIGKKIGAWPMVSTAMIGVLEMLERGWGIKDKVELVHMSPRKVKDALLDGKVDAGVLGFTPSDAARWPLPGSLLELYSVKGEAVHMIPVTEEQCRRSLSPKYGKELPGLMLKVPAGALAKHQRESWAVTCGLLLTCAYPEVDDEIVYEYVKAMAENMDKIKKVNPKSATMSREIMTMGTALINEKRHPAALRYFKESGMIK